MLFFSINPHALQHMPEWPYSIPVTTSYLCLHYIMKHLEKTLDGTTQKYCILFWTDLEGVPYKTVGVQQLASHLTNHQARWARYAGYCWRSRQKLISKFSCGLLHMDTPVLANQQRFWFISSEQTQNVVEMNC